MRIKLSKNLKWSLVGVFIIFILISCVLGFKEEKTTHTKEEEKVIYTYTTEAAAPYEVYLKPNVLYEEEKLGAGLTYLSEFVSNIKINFQHIFKGVEKQDMTGHYTVVGRLQGYYMNEDTKNIIWTKDEILVPEKQIKEQTSEQSIKEEIILDFEKYNTYVKQVLEASKANTSVELLIVLEGQLDTTVKSQSISIPLKLVTAIPLQMSYFNMTQEGMGNNSQDLKETITIQVPPNKNIVGSCIAVGILSVLAIVYLVFFTVVPTEEDVYERRVKKVFREYGRRMVAVDCVREQDFIKNYQVYSIEDLMKIAEELEKPVYYRWQEELRERNQFYVEDQQILYCYKINSAIKKEDTKEEEKES